MPTARVSTRRRRVSTRLRRTTTRQGPRAPLHLVERMQAAVIHLVNAYIDRLMRQIAPELRARFDADAFPVAPVGGQVALGEQFLATVFRAVDRQAGEDLARVAPIPSSRVLRNSAHLEQQFIHANTELIQLEARAREEVRGVVEGPLREGIRVEEVRRRIEERLGVVRSRAELIARDQTLKLYGQIQEARQRDAGITEYTWSTSDDERVRSRHRELDGTTQRWDDPPVVDERSGRRGHPGSDFQCRCAAIPLLPLDELPEPESGPEAAALEPQPVEPTPSAEELHAAAEAEAEARAQAEQQRLLRELEAQQRRLLANVAPAEPPPPPAPPPAPPAVPPAPPPPAPPPVPPAPPAPPPGAPPPPPPPSQPPSSPPPPSRKPLEKLSEFNQALRERGFAEDVDSRQLRTIKTVFGRGVTPRELDAFVGSEPVAAFEQRRSTLTAGAGAVTIGTRAKTGEVEVALKRSYVRRGGELIARHDSIELSESLQRGGLGTRIFAQQLLAYETLGVAMISLDAQKIGRYYWLKLGFDVPEVERAQYLQAFRGWLALQGFRPAAVAKLASKIQTLSELAQVRIGARAVGKEFLLGDTFDTIPNLSIRVLPGDPVYEHMKREVLKK